MPHRTTAVLRLEHRIHEEHQRAYQALHDSYVHLSEAVLTAARSRGWEGHDHIAALHALARAPQVDNGLARALGDLWLVFFECFRADEGQEVLAVFRERAAAINRRLVGLGSARGLTVVEAVEIVETLGLFWRERHEQIDARLHGQLSDSQGAGGAARDELEKLMRLVDGVVGPGTAGTPTQRLATLLTGYRDELMRRRTAADDVRANLESAVTGVRAMASGQIPEVTSASGSPAAELLMLVGQIDEARRRHESAARDLTRRLAELEADRAQLLSEIADRDQQLARVGTPNSELMLERYRAAVAVLRSGGDARGLLDDIHRDEHVTTLERTQAEAIRKACDRELEALVSRLGEWHKHGWLAADPVRLKPRLFGGPDRRSLAGIIEVAAQAAGDAAAVLQRWQRAAGARTFSQQIPALSAILRELVGLIAAHRKRQGGPPPGSISIRLDGGPGVLALPAVVLADVQSLFRKRGGSAFAAELAPLLAEVVASVRAAASTVASELPASTAAPTAVQAKEPAKELCLRQARELAAIAAHIGQHLGETSQHDDQLPVPDRHLVTATLRQVQAISNEIARIPALPPVPVARAESAIDVTALELAKWLGHVTTWRITAS